MSRSHGAFAAAVCLTAMVCSGVVPSAAPGPRPPIIDLLDHANYGSYTINESNANYGKPADNRNIAYQPRMLQLGFRTTF